MRLSDGNLTTSVNEQIRARRLFLVNLKRIAPEAVTALREDVFPIFLEVREAGGGEQITWDGIKNSDVNGNPKTTLKDVLLQWTRRFNLHHEQFDDIGDTVEDPATWLLSCLLCQMEFWFEYPTAFQEESWGQCAPVQAVPLNYKDVVVNVSSFNRGIFRYQVSEESRKQAKNRIMKELEDQVDAELNRIDGAAEKAGFTESSRSTKWESALERLIRFQVSQLSVSEIAEVETKGGVKKTNNNSIYDSLGRAEKLLAFRRREDKRGRPKK